MEKGTAHIAEVLDLFVEQFLRYLKVGGEAGETEIFRCSPVYHPFVECNFVVDKGSAAGFAAISGGQGFVFFHCVFPKIGGDSAPPVYCLICLEFVFYNARGS